jgi:kumamolisin
VQEFWDYYQIKRTGKIENIPVCGETSQLNEETTLDLQQVSSQVPAATVLMYQGHDPSFGTFATVFNRIVEDNRAQVVSVSWGLCEPGMGRAPMQTEHMIFKAAAAQGIPICAASGDDGAYDCGDEDDLSLAVDYPSSDPYVTAVGGTCLLLKEDYSRLVEVAWSGSGGGMSAVWPALAWQGESGEAPANRKTPDVAMLADPRPGYTVRYKGRWLRAGGTSFAAPNVAAFLLQMIEVADVERLGSANEMFYRMGRSTDGKLLYFDVVEGNNGNDRGPGHPTLPGWDHATGWGVPNGSEMALWYWGDEFYRSNQRQPQSKAPLVVPTRR